MAVAKQQVVEDLRGYVERLGYAYREWCVGMASEPRARLFRDHGVDEKTDEWIYRECESAPVASQVEELFVEVLGADWTPNGGDDTARWVYLYHKTAHTRP
jgi:hypothetical protein